jgi:hypothetical protein
MNFTRIRDILSGTLPDLGLLCKGTIHFKNPSKKAPLDRIHQGLQN